jgi:hypothetical protein
VLMSSHVAIAPNPNCPLDKIIDEDSWTDVEYYKKLEVRIKLVSGAKLHA